MTASVLSLRRLVIGGLLLVWILTGVRATAQEAAPSPDSRFHAATLVTTSGDSLEGEVQDWNWSRTPEQVHFRPTPASATTTYGPSELRSVETESTSRLLVSRKVHVDLVPTDPERADDFLDEKRPVTKRDTLLLEVMVDGPLSLYTRQGPRNRYYVESDGSIGELVKRRRYVEDKDAVATNHRYRQQLTNRMDGCPDVRAEAEDVDRHFRSLGTLVSQYNECVTGASSSFIQEDQARFATSFGVIGGVQRGQLALSDAITDGFGVFGWGTGYKLGAAVTARILRGDGQWALRGELVGSTQRIQVGAGREGSVIVGTSSSSANPTRSSDGTQIGVGTIRERPLSRSDFVDMQWVKATVLGRYYLATGTWRPYLDGGITAGYLVSFAAESPFEIPSGVSKRDGLLTSSLEDYVNDLGAGQRLSPGLTLGGGVSYQGVEMGLRAELSTAWASYTNFKSRLVNATLTLGYHF
jgi:hypothetical protein